MPMNPQWAGRVTAEQDKDGNSQHQKPLPTAVRGFRALTDQQYLMCSGIQKLGDWAYGKRLHDWMEEELLRMVDPSIVYIGVNRLEKKGVLEGHEMLSPDGSGRHVKIYRVTAHGEELMRLTREHREKEAPPEGG